MPRPRPPLARASLLLALVALAAPVGAQPSDPLPLPGSESETALRLRILQGLDARDGFVMRSVGSRIAGLAAMRDTVLLLGPEVFSTYNSAHPWGFNDGPLRAGRGFNAMASAGIAGRFRDLTFAFVPQIVREANLDFQTIPYPQPLVPERKVWANPFYPRPTSLDYPQRFGDSTRAAFTAQWRLALDVTPKLRVGIGDENRWWGPSVMNGTLLSANAPGFRQLFVEMPQPLATGVGRFEAQYLLGELKESEFFDFDRGNDARSLSAAILTWRAPDGWGAWPTLGVARAVMANGPPRVGTLLDFARDVGRPWARASDTTSGREQIFQLFAHWLFPAEGFEAYAEWVRFEQVASLREALEQPGHSQGYTLGAQWARPWRAGVLQLRTEVSYMEPSASIRVRPVRTSYTSAHVPQGWTHRGQMLGPAIGPAGSSQWLSGDYRKERWRAGLSLGRLRRDANYRFLNPLPPKRDDVQLYAALRAGRRLGVMDVLVEFTEGLRLNHLYQAYELGTPDGGAEGVDLLNRTLSVTLTPHLPSVLRR